MFDYLNTINIVGNMTIEEKAKAYDEALERAKAYHRNELAGSRKEMTEYIFPELRESDDEMTRNEIIAFIEQAIHRGGGTPIPKEKEDKWLAYLERQKEQSHDGKKWIYEDDYHKDMERSFNDGKDEVLENPEKYGLQKEQKLNIELIQRSWYMEGYHDREFGKEPKWIVKTEEGGPKHELNPRYGQPLADEQKPALSEEDGEIRKALVAFLEMNTGYFSCNGFTKNDIIQWLKSLRPQPKKEWSEEDEKQLDDIISIIREAYEHGITISETRHRNAYFWLNNLRPSWKPSEEQMEELWNVISYIERPSSNFLGVPALLESLYEQLQKVIGYGSTGQNIS